MPKSFRIPLVIAVILWMAVIFSFSMETASESSESSGGFIRVLLETFDPDFSSLTGDGQYAAIEALSYIVRKSAHFCIFGMLGLLVTAAASTYPFPLRKSAPVSFGICVLYAVSDEVHQLFVPGRAFMFRDIFIDSCGALCGVAAVSFLVYIVKKHKSRSIH